MIYSTNPKMDSSGIQGNAFVYDERGIHINSKPKLQPGGVFYIEAINKQASEYGMGKTNALSSRANMKAAAKLVDDGYLCQHAFDVVSKAAKKK